MRRLEELHRAEALHRLQRLERSQLFDQFEIVRTPRRRVPLGALAVVPAPQHQPTLKGEGD
eukprot:4320499-Pleurochrysis_carterae.AAC.2